MFEVFHEDARCRECGVRMPDHEPRGYWKQADPVCGRCVVGEAEIAEDERRYRRVAERMAKREARGGYTLVLGASRDGRILTFDMEEPELRGVARARAAVALPARRGEKGRWQW